MSVVDTFAEGEGTTGSILEHAAMKARGRLGRPKLSEEAEMRLDDVERRSAACYGNMELISHRFRKLAKTIRTSDGVPPPPLPTDLDDTGALRIDELRSRTSRG